MISSFRGQYKEVWRELLANKISLLFMILALVLSLTAINTIYALGKSAEKQVLEVLSNLNFGKDALLILAGGQRFMGLTPTRTDTLKLEDVQSIERLTGVKLTSPVSGGVLEVRYRDQAEKIRVEGVFPIFTLANNWQVVLGRFITEEDLQGLRKVAVVGGDIPKKFNLKQPLGEKIMISGEYFIIIGVLENKPSFSHFPLNERIYVPFTTAQRRLFNRDYLTGIKVLLFSGEDLKSMRERIRSLLRQRHKINFLAPDDFRIITPEMIVARYLATAKILQNFLLAISLVSLVISGVVILNLMSAAIEEKAGIIALRRALGASCKTIFFHYLLMSLNIALLSGLAGWLLSLGLMYLISVFTPLKPLFSWLTFLLSFFFSTLTAIIFSIGPAYRATRVDPAILLKSL